MKRKPADEGIGCHNCRHWTESTESSDETRWGFCDRYPPGATIVEDEVVVLRSWTELPFKCGEHSPTLN